MEGISGSHKDVHLVKAIIEFLGHQEKTKVVSTENAQLSQFMPSLILNLPSNLYEDININFSQRDNNKSYLQSVIGNSMSEPQNAFGYIYDFNTSIRFGDLDILKTNFNVKTTWSRCTLTSCHFHSKAVKDIFQANTEFDQACSLQVSYFPKLKTRMRF
eukprot:TRINITY_DN3128_c0_g1_i8.p1 TRINITY_DN3128_c0_g1~~TRINITY_DN3128_c0_g1_i8.p1  ORF type:complete len:159 (-),score=0.50 TRINITY_DN3128_c0_g1_i8:139-615(-)